MLKEILETKFDAVKGLIHCSGGGQTKCLKYMPEGVHLLKDGLFEAPEIFRIIREASGSDSREMFQVFNMGCRMEIYTDEPEAESLISISKAHGVDARIIGRVEEGQGISMTIRHQGEEIRYPDR